MNCPDTRAQIGLFLMYLDDIGNKRVNMNMSYYQPTRHSKCWQMLGFQTLQTPPLRCFY